MSTPHTLGSKRNFKTTFMFQKTKKGEELIWVVWQVRGKKNAESRIKRLSGKTTITQFY